MRTLEDYLSLIIAEHRYRPNFRASVSAALDPLVRLRDMVELLPSEFDVDDAIGVQLDATGQWIGRSRLVPQPLPNVWFSFDDARRGFDQGYWKGPFDVGTMLDRLDDDTYRRLLYAKIATNSWDGTIPSAQRILNGFFDDPLTYVMVEDNARVARGRNFFAFDEAGHGFEEGEWYVPGALTTTLGEMDMSVTIGVAGKIPSIVDLEIFNQNLIPLAIGAVDTEVSVTSVDRAPLFGFDVENRYISGFGVGAWGVPPKVLVDELV